jgi:hypothetical protein
MLSTKALAIADSHITTKNVVHGSPPVMPSAPFESMSIIPASSAPPIITKIPAKKISVVQSTS